MVVEDQYEQRETNRVDEIDVESVSSGDGSLGYSESGADCAPDAETEHFENE